MIIPKELNLLLLKQRDKRVVNRILKVYSALLYKKRNRSGYFDCPSAYLKKVNGQYNKVMPLLIEYGIIQYKSINKDFKYEDIFSSTLYDKKFYTPTQSMKYKFIVDTEKGFELEFNLNYEGLYDNELWYVKTRKSLLDAGFPLEMIRIKRDSFSRRLHTNITTNIETYGSYKNYFEGGDYYAIDAKTSQPRLLWLHLNEIGFQDERLNYIFDNDLDFYEYLIERIPALQIQNDKIERRAEAKELFASWLNGTGYIDQEKTMIRDIFPIANQFLRNYKTNSYKNVCRLLQSKEANIFIDDLLSNVPVDFCLTVHDSLIVKKKDVDFVLNWCKERQPEMRFDIEEIKKEK
jgi:hypothetical protein